MGKFYKAGQRLDVTEATDLLLKRYSNIEYILNLPIGEGLRLVEKAYYEESKDRVWELYLTWYPFMGEDNFISFADYLAELMPQKTDTRTSEQIIEETRKLVDGIDWRVADGNI